VKQPTSDEVDEAAESILQEIDEHIFASESVPRTTTIDFYKSIIALCKERVETTAAELEAEGEYGEYDDEDP